jgi:hypothetical protein
MSEPNSAEEPPAYLGTTTQRLMEKTNELDKMHIEREKVISELKNMLLPEGYRALDFESDDIAARLYLIAKVRPGITGEVLSYHNDSISQTYLECLRDVESKLRLYLDYVETAGDIDKLAEQMARRIANADLSSDEGRNMTKRLQRLLFVLSLQEYSRQGVQWQDTYFGKIESKIAARRQELEQTFESIHDAGFESSLASMFILNWPAWSYTLTCGKNNSSLKSPASQAEQTPSAAPTSPSAVPGTRPNGNGSSPALEPQPREKKVPTLNTPKKPVRKVPTQEWLQIR